jgi:hypothetical protein
MSASLRRAALAVALVVPLLWASRGEACGPHCNEEVAREELKECLTGELGDLSLRSPRCRALGFLRLNGKGLSSAEQELIGKALEVTPFYQWDYPLPWREAREKLVPELGPLAEITTDASFGDYNSYSNCLPGAFEMAAKTLEARVARFGAKSPEVAAWVAAQDRVFQNCPAPAAPVLPEPAPQDAPPLVQADRAYQTAAAYFYAGALDEALTRFDAIAQDEASPWRKWARLVAVRTVIRQATLTPRDEAAMNALFEKARERAVAIVKDPAMKELNRQTRSLTWFLDFRLRPEKQHTLLGRVLLEKPDENFGLAFRDFFTLRMHQEERRKWKPSTDELSVFLDSFGAKDGYATARDAWKRTKSTAWLAAALSRAKAGDAGLEELLAASASVPRESPAYVTLHTARARMAVEAGKWDEARAEVLPLLEAGAATLPPETAAALAGFLLDSARSLEEWAKYAHLTARAPGFFTHGLPLARYTDEKVLAALEPWLRKEVVQAGWTRAVLMDRWEVAQALEPHLEKVAPELAKDLARMRERTEPEARKMAARVLLLKVPGLSPFVGGPRPDPVLEFSFCGGNGWCPGSAPKYYADCEAGKAPCMPRFVSAEERQVVKQEGEAAMKFGKSPDALIQYAIGYADKNATDPLVPEALHYAVRQTRFARNDFCGGDEYEKQQKETSRLSKASFMILQKKYAKSEWAKKTPYHF